jgi:putative ABC transport system ATP-binding protein
MALIELRQLAKKFTMGTETISALAGLSFSINEGEFVSIIGPSGCGKSTLMNILGLLDQPESGAYFLDGISVESLNDDERAKIRNQKIGFVFQSFNLLPRASALRNVEMPLVYSAAYDPKYTRLGATEKAKAALERVGLKDRMNHLPSELSGGQRQRVAIARALVNNPKVILADEPTGNLDSRVGADILKVFFDLNDQGATVILVTHDPTIATRVPRVIAMADGCVREDRRNANP